MTIRKKIITLGLAVCLSALTCEQAFAFWIWTPQTKRWINPKYSPQENALLQLALVEKYFSQKQYVNALQEAKKLVSYFPKAREAAEGQYYVGLCLEELGKPYEAFKAYQYAIDKYQFSERVLEMSQRQFKIGELFLSGKQQRSFDSVLSGEDPAVEIFSQVIENAPYSEFAAASQYKLGLAFVNAKSLYEARDAFGKVLDDYPTSEWVEPAKYQLALVTAQLSGGFAYDQADMISAREQFEDFVKEHPDAKLSKEAQGKISQLKEEEAQGAFKVAVFYEKQKSWSSATVYYQYVIDNFADSPWAKRAQERLKAMGHQK